MSAPSSAPPPPPETGPVGVAGSGVQPGDSDLALALSKGLTYVEAGRRCNVSERTVARRMAEPAFRALVAESERERWSGALRKLSAKAETFAETIIDLVDEAAASKPGANVRLRAAMAGLSLRHEIGETADLEARLAELEARLGIDSRTGSWKPRAA